MGGGWFAGRGGHGYNRGMTRRISPDPLAVTLILAGVALMLVPCLLGLAALIVFGWPLFVIR